MKRAFTKSISLTLTLLAAFLVLTVQAVFAGTVKASKITNKGATISWKSERPYKKFGMRVKCLDNPVLDKNLPAVSFKMLSNRGKKRIRLNPGQKYKVTVIGISGKKGNKKAKPIGSVDLKTKGKKLDTSIDDQSKKVRIRALKGNMVKVSWSNLTGFKAIKVSIKNPRAPKVRQSGWLTKRKSYTFTKVNLKKSARLVRVEGKTDYGQTKLIREKLIPKKKK